MKRRAPWLLVLLLGLVALAILAWRSATGLRAYDLGAVKVEFPSGAPGQATITNTTGHALVVPKQASWFLHVRESSDPDNEAVIGLTDVQILLPLDTITCAWELAELPRFAELNRERYGHEVIEMAKAKNVPLFALDRQRL